MKSAKILVVEDEPDLRLVVSAGLEAEGYEVVAVPSGEKALEAMRSAPADLVLLDVMLPGMDGFEVCRILRETTDVPILFLTARDAEADRLLGLRIGGDDYVVKPFSRDELVARIHALLRRSRGLKKKILSAGGVVLDVARREAIVRGEPTPLRPLEFELLRLLLESKDKVLSRDELLKRIWGRPKGSAAETRTLDQHVARLRAMLGPEASIIETVPRVGYRIAARPPSR